jgi:hypothetical protein
MIASPEEIRELLSTVREILREHRRMALWQEAFALGGPGMPRDIFARCAVAAFDSQFPKEPS